MELENPLEFNNRVDKIKMPDSDQGDFAGDKCDISGYIENVLSVCFIIL
jgi:hypothetical protein